MDTINRDLHRPWIKSQGFRPAETERPVWVLIYGFNIAILAAILLRGSYLASHVLASHVLPFVGYRGSAWVALGGVAIYTVLVGADAAVVMEAIIGGFFL